MAFDIDFSAPGLTLIYGPTGSGKSTIPDMPCWILFGKTAKDGAADDIRPWHNLNETTLGLQEVETQKGKFTIVRTRGKAGQNDLYWKDDISPDNENRGKDIPDTQKQINSILGMDYSTFITSSYTHEFNPTGAFFTARAKDRRVIFEQLACYDLASSIHDRAGQLRKSFRAKVEQARSSSEKLQGALEYCATSIKRASQNSAAWNKTQAEKIKTLKVKTENFEKDKKEQIEKVKTQATLFEKEKDFEVEAILDRLNFLADAKRPPEAFDRGLEKLSKTAKCGVCGSLLTSVQDKVRELVTSKSQNLAYIREEIELTTKKDKLVNSVNPYKGSLASIIHADNQYEYQLEEELKRVNPYEGQLSSLMEDQEQSLVKFKAISKDIEALENDNIMLDQLISIIPTLRAAMLKKVISEVENNTNSYLSRFFDSPIRVSFDVTNTDDLDVLVQKSGYDCSFRQLSKGQRSLLKLCFVVSIMKAAANKIGVHFNSLFFDEALDGLDSDLKIKAFRLFEELQLEHESILIIEHSVEFRNLFSRKIHAILDGDLSRVEIDE